MPSNFDTRLVIWGMDSRLDLTNIQTLLGLNYNTSIEYLADKGVDELDRTLQNKWHPTDGESFTIDSYEIEGKEYKYISAIGRYEEPAGPTRAVIDGRLLPREYRVFNKTVDAVFFEISGRVYCVLEMNVSQESRVRSILFGQGYKNKKEEWGKVQFKGLPQYTLDSKFFYWLFSKRGQRITLSIENVSYSLNLIDVSAVSQLSDRDVHDNRSEGTDILGSVPALSGLGINQNVYEGGFHFLMNGINLITRIASDCTCEVDSSRSTFDTGNGVQTILSEFPKTAITIYTVIFPGLLALFHREVESGSWSATKEEEQRKSWALSVIKILSQDNNISLDDLENLFV